MSGSIVATESAGQQNAHAFQLRSLGSMNDKPFKLEFNDGPLKGHSQLCSETRNVTLGLPPAMARRPSICPLPCPSKFP